MEDAMEQVWRFYEVKPPPMFPHLDLSEKSKLEIADEEIARLTAITQIQQKQIELLLTARDAEKKRADDLIEEMNKPHYGGEDYFS
jgi:hypothetical protein